MLDQNTFTETIRAVQDIIRTSAEPMTREEILSYFKDMDLNAQQEEMVLEFLSTPHDDPQPEENEPETKEAEYEETAEKEETKESSAKKESAKDSVTDNISTSPMFQMYLEELKDIPEYTKEQQIDMYKKLLVGQLPLDDEEDDDINNVELPEEKQETEVIQSNPELLEYGDKAAEILSYTIEDENGIVTDTIEKGTEFIIRVKLHFNQKVPEPICAFSIKNVQGIEITGTNTMIEKNDIGPKEAGEDVEVSFRQKMTLQGAEYLLSLGCTGFEQGEFHVYHRLYDVCNITVISDKNTVGYYDMDTEVKIS